MQPTIQAGETVICFEQQQYAVGNTVTFHSTSTGRYAVSPGDILVGRLVERRPYSVDGLTDTPPWFNAKPENPSMDKTYGVYITRDDIRCKVLALF